MFTPFYSGFTLKVEKEIYKKTGNWREDFDSSGKPIVDLIEEIELENCFLQQMSASESEILGLSLDLYRYKIHIKKNYSLKDLKGMKCSWGDGDFKIIFTSLPIPNMPEDFSHNQFVIVEDASNE